VEDGQHIAAFAVGFLLARARSSARRQWIGHWVEVNEIEFKGVLNTGSEDGARTAQNGVWV